MVDENQGRAFISYSRLNKEFAIKLTKGLRSAGFPVWFDQLDIPTGARWDDEVEKALRECSIFLIILTPASITSENVKDEIGYAIDHGKRILPVLLEDCDVPLRLRRFQYVDFTKKNFEEGFISAKELLKDLVDEDSVPVRVKTPAPGISVQKRSEYVSTEATQKKPGLSRLGIGIIVLAVLAIAGIGFSIFSKGGNKNNPPTEAPVVENPVTEEPVVEIPAEKFDIGSTMTGDDGMILVYVPAGTFKMGNEYGEFNEQPVHEVDLYAFWIDQTEVTNKMYAGCVASGVCTLPAIIRSQSQASYYGNDQYDNFPVIYVTWEYANSYCAWAGRRLPTEAEWEKAARYTDERTYPWGMDADETLANYGENIGDTTLAGNYAGGASQYGVLDMAGNVAEWTNDWFGDTYYESSPPLNPPGPVTGNLRVVRGGSWSSSDYSMRSAFRSMEDPGSATDRIGFRCALTATP